MPEENSVIWQNSVIPFSPPNRPLICESRYQSLPRRQQLCIVSRTPDRLAVAAFAHDDLREPLGQPLAVAREQP